MKFMLMLSEVMENPTYEAGLRTASLRLAADEVIRLAIKKHFFFSIEPTTRTVFVFNEITVRMS